METREKERVENQIKKIRK